MVKCLDQVWSVKVVQLIRKRAKKTSRVCRSLTKTDGICQKHAFFRRNLQTTPRRNDVYTPKCISNKTALNRDERIVNACF